MSITYICISLKEREDRRKNITSLFEDDISFFESLKETVKRFKRIVKYVLNNDIDCDLINLEPGSGYYGDKSLFFGPSPIDEIRNGFTTRTGCYIAEKRRLEKLARRVKSSYGTDIDIALYGKCNMYSVVIPIFRQDKEFVSDNTGMYHDYFGYPTNNGLEYSRTLLTTVPLFAYLYLNLFQASIDLYSYSTGTKKRIELEDRRVK